MHRHILLASSLFLALCNPAHALDFHPLASQDLLGGTYEFDNIFIPEGVTLTFVGEPHEVVLRASQDLTLAGNLIGAGWTLLLEAGSSLQISGSIDLGGDPLAGGALTIISRGDTPGDGQEEVIVRPRGLSASVLCVTRLCTSPGELTLASGADLGINETRTNIAIGPDSFVTRGGRISIEARIPPDLSIVQIPIVGRADLSSLEIHSFASLSDLPPELRAQLSPEFLAQLSAVPEPETWAMLLAGLGLLGWRARRGNP